MGSIISDAESLDAAIERTIFDAIYCSPWTREDIIVLRVDIEGKTEFAINDEWRNKDLVTMFG
jgi:hypothetical protein